jgi:kinesin family protein 6/9
MVTIYVAACYSTILTRPIVSFVFAVTDVAIDSSETRAVLEVDIPDDADPGLLHSNETGKIQFEYDHIFDSNVDQTEVFESIAKDKVLGALEGINCTIFAYGQTGSGKTYTIFGGDSYQERGIIPRTISLLFEEFSRRVEHSESFRFEMSFTEVYKEAVYDLLDPNKRGTSIEQWTPVQIMDSDNGLVLRNINVFEVTTEEDALKLFFLGNSNRMTVATAMNSVSSRSHAVFTIIIKSESIQNGKKVYTSGKINLVDLAGSERMYKVGALC